MLSAAFCPAGRDHVRDHSHKPNLSKLDKRYSGVLFRGKSMIRFSRRNPIRLFLATFSWESTKVSASMKVFSIPTKNSWEGNLAILYSTVRVFAYLHCRYHSQELVKCLSNEQAIHQSNQGSPFAKERSRKFSSHKIKSIISNKNKSENIHIQAPKA